jgi:TP901 family phage tail tape measure protein
MDGQSKIELILELKNRMATGITRAKKSVNSSVSEMKRRFADFKASAVSNIKSVANEVPLIGNAFRLIKNPIVLAGAAVIGLTALFSNATTAAGDFYHEFLPIQQLNLDKPQHELDAYRNKILDVSMATGQAAGDTAKAFYDIQSATGLFGNDVADITRKVGDFSLATGARLPDAVNQTVKAMKAFGLGVSDIDNLLASNAKTVQVGITTFDELAKVQTEFAGAAAGAGQNVDTANKIFAAFTSIAKNSQTAATMTKTAFEGLTQQSTIKGLKSIGISMYDANGNMRDLSAVLSEVRVQFKSMSPEAIDALINKIGGPEGLRNLFVKLKTGADDFFNTMNAYDSSSFSMDEALKNAKGDFNTLKTIFNNQLNTIMIKMGEKILPSIIKGLDWITKEIPKLIKNFKQSRAEIVSYDKVIEQLGGTYENFQDNLNKTQSEAISLFEALKNTNEGSETRRYLIERINTQYGEYLPNLLTEKSSLWDIARAQNAVTEAIRNQLAQKAKQEKINAIIDNQMKREQNYLKTFVSDKAPLSSWIAGLEEYSKKANSLIWENGNFKQEQLKEAESLSAVTGIPYDTIINQFKQLSKLRKDDAKAIKSYSDLYNSYFDGSSDNPFAPTTEDDGSSPGEKQITKITGSAKQIRNITVNIDSFVKGGINTQNTELENMDAEELEKWFTDMMMRVVRNVEMSY